MPIFGVKYRTFGQIIYIYGPSDLPVETDVIFEVDQKAAFGKIISGPHKEEEIDNESTIAEFIRIASEDDLKTNESNLSLAANAMLFCKQCIKDRNLDMKLIDVEVFFDCSKFIFYFTAPSRIDFRDLVKDLVKEYHSRIELRQIGVRHETQIIGAVGNCGMVCCCRSFLRKFAPVTIKMAKEQNLFLNPAKISGICGRLLCCLSYEQDNYDMFQHKCPKLGKKYKTNTGTYKVIRTNMFRNTVSVLDENNEELEINIDEWHNNSPLRLDQQVLQSTKHFK